jgi:hypothetical protein
MITPASGPSWDSRINEARAKSAIVPGELLDFAATGNVQPHGTAGGISGRLFAVENPWDDDTSETAIDSSYGSGSMVRYLYGIQGDQIYAKLAAGEDVDEGDALESDGNGELQAVTAGTGTDHTTVAFAAEAVASGTAIARIKVRVA